MKNNLISVVIPTRNRTKLLERAIVSVINQTYPHIEIIVVDDASEGSDNVTLLEKFTDCNISIKYIKNSFPRGACFSRNLAIKNSAGEFIANLDDDDTWEPNRLESLIRNYSDKDSFVFSKYKIIGKKNKVLKPPRKVTYEMMLYKNYVGNSALVKKKRIEGIGYYDENLKAAQDFDLYLRLIQKYGCAKCTFESSAVIFQDHMDRITTSRNKMLGYLQFYSKHSKFMNKKQRMFQLNNVLRNFGKKPKLSFFINSWDFRFPFRGLKSFLSNYI